MQGYGCFNITTARLGNPDHSAVVPGAPCPYFIDGEMSGQCSVQCCLVPAHSVTTEDGYSNDGVIVVLFYPKSGNAQHHHQGLSPGRLGSY